LGGQLANEARSNRKTQNPSRAAGLEDDVQGKRYYRIGEVSRITGVKPYVLRYWESEFRWMAPQKSRSKQRLYRRRDIDMILLIKKMLYEQRFTIAGARKKLREFGADRALESGNLAIETDHRSRYRKIRSELESLRAML
jgi:DNA-binding transcriptional MerR regulator